MSFRAGCRSSPCPLRELCAPGRGLGLALALALSLPPLALTACASTGRSLPAASVDCAPSPTPVVFVPGVLGSALVDRSTGRVVWGRGRNVLFPRDHGYRLALPVPDGVDDLVEQGPVEEIKLSLYKRRVYRRLIDVFESAGYHRGRPEAPSRDDDFYMFSYDWRRDNLESVRALARFLERLRDARGGHLEVSLVCQSNGAHICRYLLKYGTASLEQAAAGRAEPLPWLEVRTLTLVGTANGGALRTLRELDRGRQFLGFLGRHVKPEVMFTLRSALQELPVHRRDLFVDTRGHVLDVDLFDAATWERLGWSIFSEQARRRIARRGRGDRFGTVEERRAYLEENLERARLLHDLLHRDTAGFPDTAYLLFENSSHETAVRVVLDDRTEPPRLVFPDDRAARSLPPAVRELLIADGDGHATVESQSWLSGQELAALGDRVVPVGGEHFEAIFEPETESALIRFHGAPTGRGACGPGSIAVAASDG